MGTNIIVFLLLLLEQLLVGAKNNKSTLQLLLVSTKESGTWLMALPLTALGPHMYDSTASVVVGL